MNSRTLPISPASSTMSLAVVLVIVVSFFMLSADIARTGAPLSSPLVHAVKFPPRHGPAAGAEDELTLRFQQAVVMLHAGKFDDAVVALHRVIELSPRMPEAYVNMGFALFGLQRYRAAHDFFMTATNLNSYQANAYWGLAVVYEKLNDLPAALGAMRTFIHLSRPGNPYLRRARSALWEWESRLKRGPLPEQDKAFLARGAQQWQERNSPRRDSADQGPIEIDLMPPSSH